MICSTQMQNVNEYEQRMCRHKTSNKKNPQPGWESLDLGLSRAGKRHNESVQLQPVLHHSKCCLSTFGVDREKHIFWDQINHPKPGI